MRALLRTALMLLKFLATVSLTKTYSKGFCFSESAKAAIEAAGGKAEVI